MPESTRREFLAAAGTVLASAPLAGTEPPHHGSSPGNEPNSGGRELPPHESHVVEGVHAYADQISVAAGETIRFHVSSSEPYELEVARLGTDVDSPARDEILHSFGPSPAAVQPIYPGSYLVAARGLDHETALSALTLEVWIRRWRTRERQAIITQFDEPRACGLGLFVNPDGSLSFYLGDGGAFVSGKMHTTPPDQLKMQINPQGLKIAPDNTPSSVLSNRWHHVVARFDGSEKQVWVDAREVASWRHEAKIRPGPASLRLGAAGADGLATGFLDADLAMPVIYAKALSPGEIQDRFASRALDRPPDPSVLACWPLNEERGDRAADCSTSGRDLKIINHGTWMIGGPSFACDVPRFGNHDPAKDPARGHGLRLASDDLFDCRWKVSHEYRIPENARSGIYAGRIRFRKDDETRLYHTVFIVRRAAARPKAPIAFLCATSTWRAYSATPFSPSWPGLKRSIGNNGFDNSPGDPPAFCLYRPHHAGQGSYLVGFRMPWPIVGPYTLMGPLEWDYSHLCRQDRFTQSWLETQGYSYDVLSDTDLHLDPAVLDGYKVLFVVGHSEYWSFESMAAVSRFLDRGGSAVVLSGNTAFWRVSFNADATIMECRKGDAPGAQVRPDRRGEMWHSHDGRRGGMSRECGFPAWRLFGLEYLSLVGAGAAGVGPYKVQSAGHFLFHKPIDLKLRDGDLLGGSPGNPLPQPIGHEADVRVSTLARFLVEPAPEGASQPAEDPAGITLLADGVADWSRVSIGAPWDYFQRPVPPGKAPPLPVAAEMIYWERPGGGRVFHTGSINSGSTLARDEKWSGLLKNVLSHFGVQL
jgi:hypothetical protein